MLIMQAALLPPPVPCQAGQPFGNGCLLPSEKASAPVALTAARCGRLPDWPARMGCTASGKRHRGLRQARRRLRMLRMTRAKHQPVRSKCKGRHAPTVQVCAATDIPVAIISSTDRLPERIQQYEGLGADDFRYDHTLNDLLHVCVPRPLSQGPGFVNTAGIHWTSKTRACCACFPGWKPSQRR